MILYSTKCVMIIVLGVKQQIACANLLEEYSVAVYAAKIPN